MPSTTRRTLAKLPNILLLIASLLVGAGLCEVALRIYYLVDRPTRIADLEESRPLPPRRIRLSLGDVIRPNPNPMRIFELRPSLRVIFPNVWMQTNRQGWRDEEFSVDKPATTVRIVGLGDSVMFGWSVDVEERYTDRLERLLAEHYPAVDWEIYTLACPGYNLAMEVETLEEEGLAYGPDMILYGYVANDTCLPNFVGAEKDVWGFESFLVDFLTDLELPAPSLTHRSDVVHEVVQQASLSLRYCTPEAVDRRYRHLVGNVVFERAFERLREISRSIDAPLMVVSHPLLDDLPEPDLPDDVLLVQGTPEAGHRGGHALLPEWRVGPGDPHPNAAGHELIAANIFRRGETEGLWRQLVERAARRSGLAGTSSDLVDVTESP